MACKAPAASAVGIDVSTAIVDFTLNNQDYTDDEVPYFYYKPPKIYDMIPKEGPTKGGTHVHIFSSEISLAWSNPIFVHQAASQSFFDNLA